MATHSNAFALVLNRGNSMLLLLKNLFPPARVKLSKNIQELPRYVRKRRSFSRALRVCVRPRRGTTLSRCYSSLLLPRAVSTETRRHGRLYRPTSLPGKFGGITVRKLRRQGVIIKHYTTIFMIIRKRKMDTLSSEKLHL